MGNQGSDLVSFALSQLLITHSDTSLSLVRRSVPLSAVGYLSLSIHKCRTYYLNPRESELFAAMSKYRPALARLIPYTFVLDESDKADLMKTVSAAWYCDIERLSMAESFREEDVDCLLGLKRIVPHTPDPHIRITVKQALIKFFQFVDQNGTGKIPVEKIAILSQWVDGLNRVRKVDDQLKTCNEKWKETNNGAVSRDTVPSDIHSSSALLFEQVYSALRNL